MRSAATGAQVGEADAVCEGEDESDGVVVTEGVTDGDTVKGEADTVEDMDGEAVRDGDVEAVTVGVAVTSATARQTPAAQANVCWFAAVSERLARRLLMAGP